VGGKGEKKKMENADSSVNNNSLAVRYRRETQGGKSAKKNARARRAEPCRSPKRVDEGKNQSRREVTREKIGPPEKPKTAAG